MLGLTRRVGEQVLIGDNIIITVTSITSGMVRLSFDAPREIKIDRPEYVAQKLSQETQGELI
jgi:carbon storage regulator|tara:strand:+ start:734 stop:919 length:186 start_codon:yes stop_codon:yes gene_type:complete